MGNPNDLDHPHTPATDETPARRLACEHATKSKALARGAASPKWQRGHRVREEFVLPFRYIPRFEAAWEQVQALGETLGWKQAAFLQHFRERNYILSLNDLEKLTSTSYASEASPTKMLGLLKAMDRVVEYHMQGYEIALQSTARPPIDIAALRTEIQSMVAGIEADIPEKAPDWSPRGL